MKSVAKDYAEQLQILSRRYPEIKALLRRISGYLDAYAKEIDDGQPCKDTDNDMG